MKLLTEVALKNLGIATDDVLNMSESAFESFKGTYLGLLNEMYSGNDDMLEMLQKLGGISSDSLKPLSGTINDVAESIDRLAGNTGNAATSVQNVSEALGEVSKADISNPIGQFDALGTSVDNTVSAISGGSAQKADTSKNTTGKHNKPDDNSDCVIGAVKDMGEAVADVIGEPGGDGTTGKFGEMSEVITGAGGHVAGIIDKLDDLDGMTAECTIKVNVETNGSVPAFADGTVNTDFESGEFTAQYGKAFAEGTGKYQGLPKDEKNALVSEYGQTEMTVLPNGDIVRRHFKWSGDCTVAAN